jgi:hypothetical protein
MMTPYAWHLPADPTVKGTWKPTSLNPLTLTGDVEVTGTLTADGAGAYQGINATYINTDVQKENETKDQTVPFAFTGRALFWVKQPTNLILIRTLSANDTLFNLEGIELIRQSINESNSDLTQQDLMDDMTDQPD